MAGLTITVNLEGLDALRRRVAEIGESDQVAAVGRILYAEAYGIINTAIPLTPVDTGFLRQSAHVDFPEVEGERVEVAFGYAAEYAVHVHERMDLHHPVGQPKFLEQPLLAWKADALGRIAAAIRQQNIFGGAGA